MEHGGNVWEGGSPERWLDFSANLRPEGPPDWVRQAMHGALAQTRYYPDRQMTAARRGLCAYLGAPQACVLPTPGGMAAIDLVLSVRRGCVYTLPVTFGEYAERAAVYGRRTAEWRGSCGPDDTVLLCNPNNPTGECATRAQMLGVWREAAARGGELIVDEAFIDFCPENSARQDVGQGLTVVGSLTKTLCIPGVRLGYVCAAPDVISRLERLALPWALNALACEVAARLPEHLKEIREDAGRNAQRRERFAASLRRAGATVRPSGSNFLLADFHRDMTPLVRALREKGILVRACSSFGLPSSFLRLAVRTEDENRFLIETLVKEMEREHAR